MPFDGLLFDALLILLGFIVLVYGADWLVEGASRLALRLGMTPLVVGLTVVAFGTSAPELAVSVTSAFSGEVDLAVGNVVGSNIANILLILGVSALFAPLLVNQQLIRLDVPIMVGASMLFYVLAVDGNLGLWDSLLMVICLVCYLGFLIYEGRRQKQQVSSDIALEVEEEADHPTPHWKNLAFIIVGGVGLVLGSHFLVKGAVSIATALGISELVIGLTVLAIGTSLPELATSVVAVKRGERDIAVGNVVGSNIFNLLCVLGVTGVVSLGNIPVSADALRVDIPVMLAVALLCLPIFRSGFMVSRLNGALFLVAYVLYLTYLVVASTSETYLPLFQDIILAGLLPSLIVLTVVLFIRDTRHENS